jgi:NAD-dependent deacetylase
MEDLIREAAELIVNSRFLTAFTGAGISVESGIPPFRGENGIWNKYDPIIFDIEYYKSNPQAALQLRKVFYDVIKIAKPNAAHKALAEMERMGLLKAVITQNIDNLHFLAGNKEVIEFHGNTRYFVCMNCGRKYLVEEVEIREDRAPVCPKCGGLLKPDFVFFGEPIPQEAFTKSFEYARKSDVMLVIGTTGVIYPASLVPVEAHESGAKIIEVNIEPSTYTDSITDIFLQGKATEVMSKLLEEVKKLRQG